MVTDAPFNPPRKKRSIMWWLGGLFLVILFLFFFQLFGPNPRIVVSRETTYITEPLDRDGLPDYEQYVLELYRQDVTPDNNAAVLLLQALWPGELDPPQYAAVATEMGLDRIPSQDDAMTRRYDVQRIAAWLNQSAKQSDPSSNETPHDPAADSAITADESFDYDDPIAETAEEILDQAMSRPWTSEQIPPLAQWVRENQKPLDLIIEASRRPRCYLPLPTLLDNQHGILVAMLLPCQQSMREAGRALATRAMWHVGEGRNDDAWRDLLALHRIAHLMTQGHTLIDQLIAIAISGLACDATLTMLDRGELSAEQARQVQRDLAALPDFTSMADCLDRMERVSYLDTVMQFSRPGGFQRQSGLGFGEGLSYLNHVSLDWNIVLRKGNEYYDRLAEAARLPTSAAREQVFSQIEDELMQLSNQVTTPGALIAAAMSPAARGDAVASVLLSLFLPAVEAAMNAEDRANATLQLTRLAAALAVYRAEHGNYPEKLDDLVPSVLGELPVDSYNSQAFLYKLTADGYLLYTAGANGTDEAGSNETMDILNGRRLDDLDGATAQKLQSKIPVGADDISIRVPRPAFKLPNTAPTADEP